MKALKKILALMLVICMLASVLAFTSCKKDDEPDDTNSTDNTGNTSENTYTITVLDGANNPVSGVTVMVEPMYKPYTSDANGKISFEADAANLKAMILSSPDGYSHSSDIVSFKSGSKELTLTVKKDADSKVTYTVKVVDQNGDPVVGAEVQLCYKDSVCLVGVNTDENGEMTNKLDAGYEVLVKLVTLPDGYTAPTPDASGYHATIAANKTAITIEVTKN